MNRDRLYLLKPGFMDQSQGPYYCPGCAELIGLLEFYPSLKQHVEIHRIDFPRPRPELVPLLGEENQSCPVLVLAAKLSHAPAGIKIQSANGHAFIEGAREIGAYWAFVHGTGIPR
jgi:hypothetical protein